MLTHRHARFGRADAASWPIANMRKDLPVLTMQPYDDKADADRRCGCRVRAGEKESGKRVLIDLGGNWCVRLHRAGQFPGAARR